METATSRIAVVICSLGRPGVLSGLLPHLAAQTLPPSRIILVVTKPEDVEDPLPDVGLPVTPEVVFSERGLSRQRNVGLERALEDSDIILYLDDDFVPSRTTLAGLDAVFRAYPDVCGVTGDLLADGIGSPGISPEAAAQMVADWDAKHPEPVRDPKVLVDNLVGLYGCNMAVRAAAVGNVRFDESFPLYSWQEDVDFANRIPGRRIKTDAFRGVHCGTKKGRESNGRLLGYSQIANPMHMIRKASVPRRFALKYMTRNFIANHVKVLAPEPWVDRRGRVAGNWLAIADLLRGRLAPERILEFAR